MLEHVPSEFENGVESIQATATVKGVTMVGVQAHDTASVFSAVGYDDVEVSDVDARRIFLLGMSEV